MAAARWEYAKGKKAVDIDLYGDEELLRLIRSLDKKLNEKLFWATMRKNSLPIIKAARINLAGARSSSGKSFKNLKKMQNAIKFRRSKKYKLVGWVGPERGTNKKYDFWFGHFIEYGTSGIKRKKTTRSAAKNKKGVMVDYRRGISSDFAGYVAGQKPGERYRADQPAQPFMRPAFDQEGGKANENMMKDLRKVIESTWKRGAKKAGWLRKAA